MNWVILVSAESRIFTKSLLSSLSISMLDFSSSTRISNNACSSCAHFSLCSCNANFIRSGSVFDTGAFRCAGFEDLLSFAFCALFAHPAYVVHTQQAFPCSCISKHPLALQKPLWENCCCSSSSAYYSSCSLTVSWLMGTTWWNSLLVSSSVRTPLHCL